MDSKEIEKEIRKRCNEEGVPVECLTPDELALFRSIIEQEEHGIKINAFAFFDPGVYSRGVIIRKGKRKKSRLENSQIIFIMKIYCAWISCDGGIQQVFVRANNKREPLAAIKERYPEVKMKDIFESNQK